jgi:2-polyprenyl-6-methoxyphenol hydroxylase-like FAD-dependent oxidoreductase
MTRSDVLIVGAGPTGLVLALWLTKLGVTRYKKALEVDRR